MHVPIGHILEREFPRARPQVAVGVPVALEVAANGAHQGEAPDVKLPVLVQEWFLDVLLDYVGAAVAVHVCVLHQGLNVVDVAAHLDAAPTIRVLSWLHDPEVLAELGKLIQESYTALVLCLVVELLKLEELWVVEALLDVESERQEVVILFADGLVVHLHVVVDGLLVAQVVVVLHLAVVEQAMGRRVLLLLFVLVLALLAGSPEDAAVLGRTAVGGGGVLLLELNLGAGVAQRCRCELALLGSRDEILFRGSALLVSGLGAQLAVDWPASGRLRAPLLVSVFRLLLLNLLPGLEAAKDLVRLPLRPYEVIILPVVVITHAPPEAGLESCTHDPRVVSSPNVIFVWREGRVRELNLLDTVRLQYLDQEFSVVLLLEIQVTLFVPGIGQVLRKLLNLF